MSSFDFNAWIIAFGMGVYEYNITTISSRNKLTRFVKMYLFSLILDYVSIKQDYFIKNIVIYDRNIDFCHILCVATSLLQHQSAGFLNSKFCVCANFR